MLMKVRFRSPMYAVSGWRTSMTSERITVLFSNF